MATEYETKHLSNDQDNSLHERSVGLLPAKNVNSLGFPLHKVAVVDIVSHLFMIAAMLLIIKLKLLGALLSGLLVYQVVLQISPSLERHLSSQRSRWFAVVFVACAVVASFTGISLGISQHLEKNITCLRSMFEHAVWFFEKSRARFPAWMLTYLPSNASEIESKIAVLLYSHATQLQESGKTAMRGIVHVLVGMVLGAIVAVGTQHNAPRAPLPEALVTRVSRFSDAFRRIVFAQAKVSALNTIFTGLYLLVVLPLFHSRLPLSKTLVIFTFLVGLLPVVGNLISNTVIVMISLASGIGIAISSLAFLILIHKLEYFLSARIVGSEIEANAWELLIAMLVMEAAFGLFGVIAAPIFYAYIKRELVLSNLI
ncbi:AI-2E family transporter [Candidatus Vallotiella sp. (ex Adelges kitamiensis)]|uniref:AI-2E family transporter n=1 Tax=Candidatus Vallotiella sp. (ex Adelges kitamiensis) TaxID=2864217 RepID=UPI001CE38542|nr:AI-2E family transporter [Candidatus Vallotia sp. (ex Adelges kitamiensis)]